MTTETILVVDPDEAVGSLLALILEAEGYKVVVTQTLPEALALLSSFHFDLIITEAFDQNRQFDFDPAFLAHLRSKAGNTPILLCSTYPSTDNMIVGEFDLAEIVTKPFDIDDLLGKVRRALARSG